MFYLGKVVIFVDIEVVVCIFEGVVMYMLLLCNVVFDEIIGGIVFFKLENF